MYKNRQNWKRLYVEGATHLFCEWKVGDYKEYWSTHSNRMDDKVPKRYISLQTKAIERIVWIPEHFPSDW